jgi:hypothetical protein
MKTLITAIHFLLFIETGQQELPGDKIRTGERPNADPQPGNGGH